eukprot:2871086-Pleurochrysis_carterae.AAC.1
MSVNLSLKARVKNCTLIFASNFAGGQRVTATSAPSPRPESFAIHREARPRTGQARRALLPSLLLVRRPSTYGVRLLYGPDRGQQILSVTFHKCSVTSRRLASYWMIGLQIVIIACPWLLRSSRLFVASFRFELLFFRASQAEAWQAGEITVGEARCAVIDALTFLGARA